MNYKYNSGDNINFIDFSSSARPVYPGSTSSPTCSFEALNKVVITNIQHQRISTNEPEEKLEVSKQ